MPFLPTVFCRPHNSRKRQICLLLSMRRALYAEFAKKARYEVSRLFLTVKSDPLGRLVRLLRAVPLLLLLIHSPLRLPLPQCRYLWWCFLQLNASLSFCRRVSTYVSLENHGQYEKEMICMLDDFTSLQWRTTPIQARSSRISSSSIHEGLDARISSVSILLFEQL